MNKRRDQAFSESVRKAMRDWAREPMHLDKIFAALDLIGSVDKKPLYDTIRDFLKSGEIEKTAPNTYRYIGTAAERGRPQLREVMWRLLRARKSVTVDDLVELAGAGSAYVAEWLQMLARQGIVQRRGSKYVLVADPVEMPTDDSKAERLRLIRERKKTALNKLDACINLCLEARMAVAEALEDGN